MSNATQHSGMPPHNQLDDLQYFVLSGLVKHPDLACKCAMHWFADRPLRLRVFQALCKLTSLRRPVNILTLAEACSDVPPSHIVGLFDSPCSSKVRLESDIRLLECAVKTRTRQKKIIIAAGGSRDAA